MQCLLTSIKARKKSSKFNEGLVNIAPHPGPLPKERDILFQLLVVVVAVMVTLGLDIQLFFKSLLQINTGLVGQAQ